MKKIILVVLSAVMALSITGMSACGDGKEYSVTFDKNCYAEVIVPSGLTVKGGGKITEPETPSREGYSFTGWYSDASLTEKWDFMKDAVKKETVLYAGWMRSGVTDKISYPDTDKDFSKLYTPGQQEAAYDYKTYFLPSKNGSVQPYVGDTMPYYENGTYYIYYLKDGGDSYNHSIFVATTKDFVNYEERGEVVLESDRGDAQDSWIGTGSLVKVENKYYFFYTGHNGSESKEFNETIMVAEGSSPTNFVKKTGWQITPPASLGQKRDFRDPNAVYDPESGKINLTVTAAQNGRARILKLTLDKDLSNVVYNGIIFTDSTGKYMNLECSDTFKVGDKWYLTYSAQDDTMFYASSDNEYGPYDEPKILDGKLFYAAKHVSDGTDTYLVGWARRSESVSSTQDVSGWAGNMIAQKVVSDGNGGIYLAPVDYSSLLKTRRALAVNSTSVVLESGSRISYTDAFNCYERYIVEGDLSFTNGGEFGFAFDYNGTENKYKTIYINPANGVIGLAFNKGSTVITEIPVSLSAKKEYSFKYMQEGSVGVFYIDGKVALTVRLYGCTGKNVKLFASNNNVTLSSVTIYT